MNEDALRVTVTIATRSRPRGCARLVDAVFSQTLPASWSLRVVVIDNEPAGSGLDLVQDERLTQLHEPMPGIPLARNRGLAEALPDADVVVFIDDDEYPVRADWLSTLVQALDELAADVVSGPVHPDFPPATPEWLARHPVFVRRSRQTGSELRTTYTGNTAVRSSIFRVGLRFDPAFRFSGGSDTQLFRQARDAGARIRWVSEAVVAEEVPPERATVRWILQRSMRIGANRVQFLRAEQHFDVGRWTFLVLGSGVEMISIVLVPFLSLVSRKWGLVLAGRSARGFGTLVCLARSVPDAYSR